MPYFHIFNKNRISYTGLIMGAILLFSCVKNEEYPVEPVITFKNFYKLQDSTMTDNKGLLVFSFTDGDGDIGLSDDDTIAPFDSSSSFYYNLFIHYYERQHGQLVEVELTVPQHQRLPVLTPEGKSKAIKGDIEVELFINNPFSTYDTIAYEFYLYDRSLNKSNVILTPDIIVNK